MKVLGIDMGGTATRWVIRDAQGLHARGTAPGATGLIGEPANRKRFEAAIAAVPAQDFSHAVLGITGCGLRPERALLDVVQALLPGAAVTVMNDMELSWRAAFGKGPGHLVLAGTGSVGMSIDAEGRITAVGGRGTLVDDAGGGAWIALRALDAVCRLVDRHGSPRGAETLADALGRAAGAEGWDWDALRLHVYGTERGMIGTLAQAVALAAQQGDALALDILTVAGTELARLAQDLLARCGPAPVAVTGRALDLHPAILDAMAAALPGVTLSRRRLDAAAFAAEIAWEHAS